MADAKKIGIDVKAPEKACNDRKCPFHGNLTVRGRIFVGNVISAKSKNTATVMWERKYYIPKYERYEVRKTKLHVHNPECIGASDGDIVKISECRPLSKTKNFVIIEKVGKVKKIVGEDVSLGSKKKEEEKRDDKEAKHEKAKEKPKQPQKPAQKSKKESNENK